MKLKNVKILRHFDANGFTLIGVLMLIVLITVLGVGILTVTGNSLKLSSNERTDQSTFYIAEAGIVETRKAMEITVQKAYKDAYEETKAEYNRLPIKEQAAFNFAAKLEGYYLSKVKTELSKLSPRHLNSFESTYRENNTLTKPVAKVNVKIDKETGEELNYKITSVGTIGNKERTVSQNLIVNLKVGNLGAPGTPGTPETPGTPGQGYPIEGLPENMAIIVKNDVELKNSATVVGNIGILKSGTGNIKKGNSATINGSLYKLESIPKLPQFPNPPDNIPTETWKVSNGGTLTIDIGGKDKEIVIDNLEIGNSGKIIIKGTGKLTLHVKNKLDFDNSAQFNVGSRSKNVEIFYSGKNKLDFKNSSMIYASIYAKEADIDIGNSAEIHGNILSGGNSFVLGNSGIVSPSLYFAPNAQFEIKNSGKVKGTIIGKSIIINNSGEVVYGEPQFDTWVPGTPSKPSTPGTPPTMAENPNLIKRENLIEN